MCFLNFQNSKSTKEICKQIKSKLQLLGRIHHKQFMEVRHCDYCTSVKSEPALLLPLYWVGTFGELTKRNIQQILHTYNMSSGM
jgi:hypothetical protein